MKKVFVLLAEGFEEIEALTVVDVVRRAGIQCDMVSLLEKDVTGAHGITVKSDKGISDDLKDYDLMVLPGGMPGSTYLKEDPRVIELVKYFDKNSKIIAATCAAPIVLSAANIIENRNITSYPGFEDQLVGANYLEEVVVVDKNIITSRGPATTLAFAFKIVELLGSDKYKDLSKGMMYNFLSSKI